MTDPIVEDRVLEPADDEPARAGLPGYVKAMLAVGALGCGGFLFLFVVVLAVPNVVSKLNEAMAQKAKADIRTLESAAELYAIQHDGKFPPSLKSLDAGDVPAADPWGNPYDYELLETGVRITSYGSDGAPGGTGPAQDIDNQTMREQE